jgi:hypothetical protein
MPTTSVSTHRVDRERRDRPLDDQTRTRRGLSPPLSDKVGAAGPREAQGAQLAGLAPAHLRRWCHEASVKILLSARALDDKLVQTE